MTKVHAASFGESIPIGIEAVAEERSPKVEDVLGTRDGPKHAMSYTRQADLWKKKLVSVEKWYIVV